MDVEEKKPHYGYYALPIIIALSVIITLVGALVFVFLSQVVGAILVLFSIYVFSAYGISMYFIRQRKTAGDS